MLQKIHQERLLADDICFESVTRIASADHHPQDIIGYVMEGSSYVLGEGGERIEISAGDRLVIHKGAWHAEGEVTERMVYLVTIPAPIPFLEALAPLEPQGRWPT